MGWLHSMYYAMAYGMRAMYAMAYGVGSIYTMYHRLCMRLSIALYCVTV